MKKELKNSLKAGTLPVFYIGLYLLYYLWIFAFEKIYQYYAAILFKLRSLAVCALSADMLSLC